MDIPQHRLYHQHLAGNPAPTPAEVVHGLGAVQAQEYPAALWALGVRAAGATAAAVEQAIAARAIVRIWFMRGTLHFVAGPDLRWMLDLMAPRMRALLANLNRYQGLGLDEARLAQSNAALAEAVAGDRARTRPELAAVLTAAGLPARGVGLSLMVQWAQAAGQICYGPPRGNQLTFVLLDEWLPPAPAVPRAAALAAFARRYFTSHGPATLQDFLWWSGLSAAEGRAGLADAAPHLAHAEVSGRTYWFPTGDPPAEPAPAAVLLPTYDEYIVGYKDRSAIIRGPHAHPENPRENVVGRPTIVLDGQIVGTWKRTVTKAGVSVALEPFAPLTAAATDAVDAARARYAAFLGLPLLA